MASVWTGLIWNRARLQQLLTTYLRHYDTARPHRGINLQVPIPGRALKAYTDPDARVDVLGGLIHEYLRAA